MRFVVLLAILLAPTGAHADSLASLLATLHRAQDALALEGETARPVHDRLIHMLDRRIGSQGPHETGVVVAYALSGGDPRIAARALAKVPQTARDAILVRGVLAHVSGRSGEARQLLGLIRPERLRGRLGSLVAMARAGAAARVEDADGARRLWDRVRLDAPGTLLEEAALRRLIGLALEREDEDRFFGLLRRYWTRYPRSAFRGRVVRTMRRGVSAFAEDVVLRHLPRISVALPERVRSDLYAHVARSALLDGHPRLATVASRRKGALISPHRARLLKNVARLTDEGARRTHADLAAMPLAPLEAGDRRLLLAARAIGRAIGAPLTHPTAELKVVGPFTRKHRAVLDGVDELLAAQ